MPLGLNMSGPARGVVASAEAFDRSDPSVDEAAYVRFLEEARQAARLKLSPRCAISLVATDRVGLVADVTEALARERMNIEAASHATLGGYSVLGLVVSNGEPIDELGLRATLCRISGVDDECLAVDRISELPNPMPTSSDGLWHIHIEAADRPGVFQRVAAVVADHDGWLVRFGTSTAGTPAKRKCVLDLNVALPRAVDLGSVKRAVHAALADDVTELRFEPSTSPVAGPLGLLPSPAIPSGVDFLSVMGEARPGLIASVTRDLAAAGLTIGGSTMAILEGRTLAVFALTGADGDLRKVEHALQGSVNDFELRVAAFPRPTPQKVARSDELLRFFCLTQERRGVLASAARALAESRANIESVSARVIGPNTSACVVNMFVRVPTSNLEALRLALTRLADSGRWIEWRLEPSGGDGHFATMY